MKTSVQKAFVSKGVSKGFDKTPAARQAIAVAVGWIVLCVAWGLWTAQRMERELTDDLAASAEYEATTTARIIDRLFTEMTSVANMVARQADVIRLANQHRIDPPGTEALEREDRAARFVADPLVRKVGDYLHALSEDLRYARIYVTNMSHDTITASNWAYPDSIVGMNYAGRSYLTGALQDGTATSFGIARLLKTQSYFVASRIDDATDEAQGAVTIKFDAPDMASYLVGRHIAVIANEQGRVTTTSHEPFMLRNIAPLLPDISAAAPGDEEGPGDPLAITSLEKGHSGDQWVIEGKPYLVKHQALADGHYQLVTLASMDEMSVLRQRQYWIAALIAIVGSILILLGGRVLNETARRRQEERYAAHHDPLTDLPNRRAMLAELDSLFARARRTGEQVVVAFIDLDGFKTINDAYGHEIGDRFLKTVSQRLSSGLRDSDVLGRWGGDEFILAGLAAPATDSTPCDVKEAVRNRLTPLLVGTYDVGGIRFHYPGASLGIAAANALESSPTAVIKEADTLMYADKQARQSQFDAKQH